MSPTALLLLVAVNAGVLLAFVVARRLTGLVGHPPLLSPVLVAAVIVAGGCYLAKLDLVRFEELTWPIRWALGPAIVALGSLLHTARAALRAQLAKLLVAVAGGTLVGIACAIGLARLTGLDTLLGAALVTKTISSPFAVLIQLRVGGPVELAAAFAVITGVIGAVIVPPLLARARLTGAATSGLAMGVAAHLVGTDAIARRDGKAGAFAGGATVIAGVIAATLIPLAWRWLR